MDENDTKVDENVTGVDENVTGFVIYEIRHIDVRTPPIRPEDA
ncbi:hypothetical protein [Streptomyces sp. NBC_01314]|nr:hypothetical protein OG622_14080 [Streptomyces sp. NBC_01314]